MMDDFINQSQLAGAAAVACSDLLGLVMPFKVIAFFKMPATFTVTISISGFHSSTTRTDNSPIRSCRKYEINDPYNDSENHSTWQTVKGRINWHKKPSVC